MLVPIVKYKSDVQSCDCSGIKLMNHSMKIWERAVEGRLRREVISEQYDFLLRKRITDVMFGQRMLIEKIRRSCTVFVDLEKAYDGVPRDTVVLH